MKRTWLLTSSLLIIIVCAAILVLLWLFPLLAAPDAANVAAATAVLNRTSINRITQVDPFTGGQLERTVEGTDSLGRKVFVFVIGQQLYSVRENSVISADKAAAIVERQHQVRSIVSVTPGIFRLTTSKPVSGSPLEVWEVSAKLENGEYLFAYLDLHTGSEVYEFTTAPIVSVSPQVTGAF